MPRVRTTKALAKRIDLNYFKRWDPLALVRRVLVVLCFVAAFAWWAIDYKVGRGESYNPGPVASVHAMWESDCRVCHDRKRGFYETVTDAACLKCHDGAIHHPNQATLIGEDADGHRRAANCTACHIEHRGHDALMGTADANCTRCHRDLARHESPGHAVPVGMETVERFNQQGHPPFGLHPTPGSSLVSIVSGTPGRPMVSLRDVTALGTFRHDTNHLPERASGESDSSYASRLSARCVRCHEPLQPSPLATPKDPSLETIDKADPRKWGMIPVLLPTDGFKQWAGSGSKRYTRPVNYERHCAVCHNLDFPGGDEHFSPDIKGPQRLPHSDLALLAPAVQRQVDVAIREANGTFAQKATGLRGKPQKLDEKKWLEANAKFMLNLMKSSVPAYSDRVEVSRGQTGKVDREGFERLYVAYVAFRTCAKCHQILGDFPSFDASSKSVDGPIRTAPTRITSEPRRWFSHSSFDHDAHRAMQCTECHAWQKTLAPANPEPSTAPTLPGIPAQLPALALCARCHQPHSAGDACVTCHVFHDRTRERAPNGPYTISGAKEGRQIAAPTGVIAPSPEGGRK